MSYSKFKKLEQLREDFGIKDIMIQWLPTDLKKFGNISNFLLEALQEASIEVLTTEKAQSEYIIVPILKELRRQSIHKFSTFSGFEFNVGKKLKLTGFCDFMLSYETNRAEITAPIFCLVGAKDGEIDQGFAQCAAEMYAAQLYNEKKGQSRKQIFIFVTFQPKGCDAML